jgi:hypothetical protein
MDEKYRKIDYGLPEKLGGNLKTLEKVYDSAFSELKEKDLQEVAVKCGARIGADNILVIDYFQKTVRIDIKNCKLNYEGSGEEVDLFTATIILHYVITADGEAISGEWISYRELPDGMFYSRTIPGVLEPLRQKYETSFEKFLEKASQHGGERNSSFRNGAVIYPFPYFPVMLILEEKSEEFDSDLRILFDSSAPHYMKTDIVKTLIVNIVKILLRG